MDPKRLPSLADADTTLDKVLGYYRTMWTIRRFDETIDELFAAGQVHGTTHLYIGQEAVATGVVGEMQEGDMLTSTHRGHGHNIALGGDIRAMMAELLGRETGYGRGRGGSMHIADQLRGNLGANGIVAGGVSIAVGAALGSHLKGRQQVVVAFLGDGALNEGGVHEAANLAAIWQLPVVFVVENNQYGMSGSVREMFRIARLADRAAAYGMPGMIVDGMDVFAVAESARTALENARNGGGPSLIEAQTYRFKGHSKSDANRYRTREEIQLWRKRDPIQLVKDYLLAHGATEEQLAAIVAEVRQEVHGALKYAESSPWPDPAGLTDDAVYATQGGETLG